MPKLISTRSKKRRPAPPCGRIVLHVEPHSPFQKLIDGRRAELGYSNRELAREMSRTIKTPQSTLFTWLHNTNGFPHPKAFKPAHLKALAQILKLKENEIKLALDGSRHLYTGRETPMPLKSKDAFRTFIEILQRDDRKTVTLSYVRNLAINLFQGATGETV